MGKERLHWQALLDFNIGRGGEGGNFVVKMWRIRNKDCMTGDKILYLYFDFCYLSMKPESVSPRVKAD